MANIPDAAKKVPLMFQAQTAGRCQVQYVATKDAQRWTSEWIEKAYPDAPDFGTEVRTHTSSINWRFVTNCGQDDGVTRPVIGAKGWPFYPGSSMKGIFRRACTPEQAERYCGKNINNGDFQPGILRFHGGYPTDERWQDRLVDIVHPQQDCQVKDSSRSSAFVQISLYKPELKFGISSTISLPESEWETIWNIWEKALSTGIGCRVSAGYGQPEKQKGEIIHRVQLQGQGQASKLLDGTTGEFRPNMFKAALRGHALRIFGGLTNANTASSLVETLFGGVQGEGIVGLVAMTFRETSLDLGEFGQGNWAVPSYKVAGSLSWLLTQDLPDTKQEALQKLVKALTRFAMVLGGFGKSWRRADHRLFFPEYYDDENPKPLIGCHWQWNGERSLLNDVRVRKLEQVGSFIDEVRLAASEWIQLQGITPSSSLYANAWREAWHPQKVQVWGRNADEPEDSEVVRWLHGPYRKAFRQAGVTEGSIYRTPVTGGVGEIGRIWHRMYPVVQLRKNPEDPKKPIPKKTNQYLELLTIFPDDSTELEQFLEFLNSKESPLQKLWSV